MSLGAVSFDVRIDHGDGSVTVHLAGTLDRSSAPVLREEMWPLLARYEAEMVTIDAGDLSGIDADGLGVLESFARAMTPGRPHLRGADPGLASSLGASGCFELAEGER